MNPSVSGEPALPRIASAAAAVLIVVCVAVLAADYFTARRRDPRDQAAIAELQAKVRVDAKLAPQLEAEHKRITEARRARKARIDWLSLLLVMAAAAFLWGAKRLPAFGYPKPVPKEILVKPKPAAPPARAPSLRSPLIAGTGAAPSIDLALVDKIVAREGRTAEAAIPILQAIQSRFRYLPDEALARVCELTDITPAQIAGTSSFYAQMRRTPIGEHLVRVCHGTACHVAGARQIAEELRRSLGIQEGADTDAARRFTLAEVACLGCCSLAPCLMLDERTVGNLTPASACEAIAPAEARESA